MYLIIFIIIFLILLTIAIASNSLAPWVPCWSKDLKRIFALADLKPGEKFYDLGCGNGKTVIYAAKNFQAQAIGIELALPLWFWCKLKQLFLQDKNIKFRWGNIFKQDFSNADVIYVFGMPKKLQQKLKQKLEKELKQGTRVISYTFPIVGWEPVKVSKPTNRDIAVYLYRM
ncbi:MAG: class I SAM-dependent methyltransferase [Candidatus Falkowbacteria bacterium]